MSETSTFRACVNLEAAHVPGKYFRPRPELFIGPGFRERILSVARQSEKGLEMKASAPALYTEKELKKGGVLDKRDAEVEALLPAEHLFDESKLCAFIEALIETRVQFLPEKGGYLIFYTQTSVVWLYRSKVRGDFILDARRRGGGQWYGDVRVFHPDPPTT